MIIADDFCFLGCYGKNLIAPTHLLERSADYLLEIVWKYREAVKNHDFYAAYDYDRGCGSGCCVESPSTIWMADGHYRSGVRTRCIELKIVSPQDHIELAVLNGPRL